jgi:predicted nucleic acid-binding protein
MTDRLFFDTNLLVYVLDAGDPAKRKVASEWLRRAVDRSVLVLSPQVLNEWYRVSGQRFPSVSRAERQRFLLQLLPACTAPLDATTTVTAWSIESNHGYSWWDCLILASAIQAGCKFILSEDLQDRHKIGELTIVDPFRSHPDSLLPPN